MHPRTKVRMKHVGHIVWPVGDAALLGVLALQNEGGEFLAIDPMHLAEHGQ